MNKKSLLFSLFLVLICRILFSQPTQSLSKGEIEQEFNKLRKGASVLYLAAHPDDENTRLISYLANELNLRTGYLSLTRGDGGQNLIGPEQGIELGVIRTRELLAARIKDGGEQFFTRAYDFGYSKNPEETFNKWNREEVLYDVVYVIRKFQPDLIITRFATDGSGGHGHHTASAMLAEEAFIAAANPNRFPEQLTSVKPWKTKRLFHNSTARFFNPNADLSHLIKLDVGGFNTNLGKSYGEISAESRSMHKSQGFGSAMQRGEQFEYFKPIMGDTQNLNGSIFQDLETSNKLIDEKGYYEKIVINIYKSWINNDLKSANEMIYQARERLKLLGKDESFYHFKILEKIQLSINGIFLESIVEKSAIIPQGDSLNIKVNFISRMNPNIKIQEIILQQIGGDNSCMNKIVKVDVKEQLKTNLMFSKSIRTFVCEGKPGKLFWLKSNPTNGLFNQVKPFEIGIDYGQDFYLPLTWNILIDGKELKVTRNVYFKQIDPEHGELHRNFVAGNPIQLELLNDVVISKNNAPTKCSVKLKGIGITSKYSVFLDLPKNWACNNSPQEIELKRDEEKTIQFEITPEKGASSGDLKVYAKSNGNIYQEGIKEIKYKHIPTQVIFNESKGKIINLQLNQIKKNIAYVPGAGDEISTCLKLIGYEVTELNNERLTKEDLAQYETIIFGVRAFNTNEELSKMKSKFLDYMTNGGTILVQYNTNSWAGPLQSDIGPYKFKITRDRVTDEQAKVSFLEPEQSVLNRPNKISDSDFESWIQERGIYFAGDIDSNYQSILGMSDPNEKMNKGSLIIGKYGKGNFIYTGLAFFRQLPAGVPGAYRLFVNLIELK
jgi:LmbE family N-acetylglucosaminyl deacetylase